MALGLTQPLTNEYQKIFMGDKAQLEHKYDNFSAICQAIV
jgi:hypothetical protein